METSKERLNTKLIILFSHINDSTYNEQILKAFDSSLFDHCIVTLWKAFMLFVYQRVKQAREILGEDVFEQKWKAIFKADKYDLVKYDSTNIYAYNQLEDEEVVNFLNVLYAIDSNFLRKLKGLKQDRHTAAHVCDPALFATVDIVQNYLSELVPIISKIQSEHESKFLEPAPNEIVSRITLSAKDKDSINSKKISDLASAGTFSDANAIMRFLKPELGTLTDKQLKEILSNSLKNGGMYNQVLDATSASAFFEAIFDLDKISLQEWTEFYLERAKSGFSIAHDSSEGKGFTWLKRKLIEGDIDIVNMLEASYDAYRKGLLKEKF